MESNNGTTGPVPTEKGHISEADHVRANGGDSNASLEKTHADGVADVPIVASFANVDEKKVLRKVRAASQPASLPACQPEFPKTFCARLANTDIRMI